MKLARRVRFAFVILYLSLATCVLGRPHPSSASSEHSAVEVLEQGLLPSFSPLVVFLHVSTVVEVPFKQERRVLKGSGGRGAIIAGSSGGGGSGSGGGGGGSLSTTVIIILVVLIVTLVLSFVALLWWCYFKKQKNPNWRFVDYFKRKKPTAEKTFTSVKSDVDPDGAAEHKMTIDVPRLDHASKSRKQASLNQEFKSASTFQ